MNGVRLEELDSRSSCSKNDFIRPVLELQCELFDSVLQNEREFQLVERDLMPLRVVENGLNLRDRAEAPSRSHAADRC